MSDQKTIFKELLTKVATDCFHVSMPGIIAQHPAFNQILDMGRQIVPWLIEDLDIITTTYPFSTRNISLLLLPKITKQCPILKHHRGKINKMIQDWKIWYLKSNGVY